MAARLGAHLVMAKPFTVEELHAAVARVLEAPAVPSPPKPV
jgi:DNA-binding response OmpR family regulator